MMLEFLRPFVTAGYWVRRYLFIFRILDFPTDTNVEKVPSVYGPDAFFNLPLCEGSTSTSHSSGPSPPYAEIIHFSHRLTLTVPLVTSAAALLTTAYTEALQTCETFPFSAYTQPVDRATADALGSSGPTLQNILEFHFQERIHKPPQCNPDVNIIYEDQIESDSEVHSPLNGSSKYDEDWFRLVNCYDARAAPSPLRGTVYRPGSLAGTWKDAAVGPLGDEDFLRAWLPSGVYIQSLEDAIEVIDPGANLSTRYDTFIPGSEGPYFRAKIERSWISDTLPSSIGNYTGNTSNDETLYIDDDDDQKSSGICDILLTGETSREHGNAWGHFTLIGRVRPWDGFIVLLRSSQDHGDISEWLFKGYLHDQNLVGRWRELFTPVNSIGFEGAFVLNKNE
ncbi:hypothetical protein H0H81_012038 [Sphagnurus paluster]|uniref:Uncharacterized protein n=1 Tax=Sphagnurus paluster TaxID=117069 RepID=A0A9P7FY83_9AGAR|nr:hypothetical protein H0H81_012038 [Sphagnurus paluster]